MSARDCLLIGTCIGAVLSGFVFAYIAPAMGESSQDLIHRPRLSKDKVQVVVEGEFTLHHQDCILFNVYVQHGYGWEKRLTTYECGRGLIPSNPLPLDSGVDDDWDWEELVMR